MAPHENVRQMTKLHVQAIGVCLGSGLLLAVANLLLPFAFTPAFAFGLGILAFARVFMAPGPLTARRDLLMFSVIVAALIIAWSLTALACDMWLAATGRCTDRYLRTAGFVNVMSAALPIVFFWSWVRIRLLRERLAGRWRR
jgi:hypothetical protein